MGLVFAALLLLLALPWSTAQAAPRYISASLVAETLEPEPGSTVRLAIRMVPKKGWHGYWVNPGESGLPVDVSWEAPEGIEFGELRHPAPTLLEVQGIASYVHEGTFTLLTEMSVPAGMRAGTSLPVTAHLSWLACSDTLCVPERATLTTELRIGTGSPNPEGASLISEAATRLPSLLTGSTIAREQGKWVFTVADGGRLREASTRLYPAQSDWFAAAARQSVERTGNSLRIEVAAQADAPGGTFAGVVSDGKNSFRISANRSAATASGMGNRGGEAQPQAEEAEEAVIGAGPADSIAAPPPAGEEKTEQLAAARSDVPESIASVLAVSLLAAVLGGLLLNLMPCVFPILSLKALNLARAGGDRATARSEGLGYTAGSVATATALGGVVLALKAAGEEVGWSFQLQSPVVILLLLMLTSAIALNLAGLFEMRLALPGGRASQRHGFAGGFSTGALAALIAAPCSGPFMAGALGAALVLPPGPALAIFAGLGLGMALPFLAVAFVPALQARLPKPGAWMNTLRRVLSLPMFATALALAWVLGRQVGVNGMAIGIAVTVVLGVGLWWLGTRQQTGRTSWSALAPAVLALGAIFILGLPTEEPVTARSGESTLHQPFSEERLAALRREGTPVFVDFTADWCLTCKVNEKVAIDTDTAQDAFASAGVVTLIGDWTTADPEITRFLEKHGRNSIPFYLFYPAEGDAKVLPQILTPGLLADLARQEMR
ncbi:hypothetical protein TZ53_23115 (plasmid) [Sphingobium sp. YBL2]|nr:hypothetical protein TZ53_23115 [Sphingobium sp. YBL2]